MKRADVEAKLEFLETSADAQAAGLRRIKRRHIVAPGEMTLRDCKVMIEIEIDADILSYFKTETDEAAYKAKINSVLREKMEEATAKKTKEIQKLRRELLADTEFLRELKEKLAA